MPSGGGGGASGDPGSGTWLGGQSGNIGGYTDTNLPGEAGADFGSPVEQGTVPGDNLRQYGAGAAGAAGSVSDGGWSGASGNQGNPGTLEIEWVYAN